MTTDTNTPNDAHLVPLASSDRGPLPDVTTLSPEAARELRVSLGNDKTFLKTYLSGGIPGHQESVAYMRSLYAREAGAEVEKRGTLHLPKKDGVQRVDGPQPGAERVVSSNADSTLEAKAEAAMAAPESPDGYKLADQIRHMTPGDQWTEESDAAVGHLRTAMHSVGGSQGDFDALLLDWQSRAVKGFGNEAAHVAEHDATMQSLERRFGPEGAQGKIKDARQVLAGMPESARTPLLQALEVSGMGNSEAVILRLASIYERQSARGRK